MHLTRQSKRSHLRLLGIAVSAVLLATPPTRAQGTSCATVRAASLKMFEVPYHMYLIDSATAAVQLNGGKPMLGEVIAAGGNMYVLNHGKWIKSPVSLAEMKAQQDKSDSTRSACTRLRDESVNGEATAVWRLHMVNDIATYDTDMWISKSRGVVLKAASITSVGGRSSSRYEYTNVRVPVVAP